MNRPAAPAILQANLVLFATIVIGLLAAIVLGFTLGESEFMPIILVGAVVLAVLFAVGLYQYVWQTSLFLLFCDFLYRPTGFTFGALEISGALGAGLAGIFIWQKRVQKSSLLLDHSSVKFLKNALLVWLIYVVLHLIFNLNLPYRPSEFAFSNFIKSYFAASAPLALLYYFSRSPAAMVVKGNFFWRVSQLCLFGLLLNIGIRSYQMSGGRGLFIPGINATYGVYALRTLGPLAMMLGCTGITSPRGSRSGIRYATFWLLLVAGTIGASISGGRATLVIGFVAVCALLVLRAKVIALFIVVIVGILGIAAANLSSDWVNTKADPIVQRSLQWALLHKKGEATRGIENSSEWRRDLFFRTIDEWRSDPRIFWTGRATYGFGTADETAIMIAGSYKAMIETALRRGTTHNLISDLLIAYGIIGLILYLTVFVGILRFLFYIYSRRELSPAATDLALVTLVGSALWFVYSVLGGNFYPTEYVFFLIILISAIYRGVGVGVIELEPRAARPRQSLQARQHGAPKPQGSRRLVHARHADPGAVG